MNTKVKVDVNKTEKPAIDRTLLRLETDWILKKLSEYVGRIGRVKNLSSQAHMGLVTGLDSSVDSLREISTNLLEAIDGLSEENRNLRVALATKDGPCEHCQD